MGKSRDSALVEDLILSCAGEGVSSETAQKAIRALCHLKKAKCGAFCMDLFNNQPGY
jgi:hypothetical protein